MLCILSQIGTKTISNTEEKLPIPIVNWKWYKFKADIGNNGKRMKLFGPSSKSICSKLKFTNCLWKSFGQRIPIGNIQQKTLCACEQFHCFDKFLLPPSSIQHPLRSFGQYQDKIVFKIAIIFDCIIKLRNYSHHTLGLDWMVKFEIVCGIFSSKWIGQAR